MAELDLIKKNLLEQVAGLHDMPQGAFSLRVDGELFDASSTANIEIVKNAAKTGIEIHVKPGTKNESIYIPVLLAKAGVREVVYNDFYIGADADITIIAGCGIHNCGDGVNEHSGIHTFYLGANARVRYVEKHYGEGDGHGQNVMNPTTMAELERGAYMEIETTQIKGVDSTFLTLHMGLGHFRTVDVEDLSKHKMDSEQMIISEETANKINSTKAAGSKVFAVGITVVRALETPVTTRAEVKPYDGWTNKFIFPPYAFAIPDALVTNFHLPSSTMLMSVAAFGGFDNVMNAYKVALKEGYSFGTYGDAMLII